MRSLVDVVSGGQHWLNLSAPNRHHSQGMTTLEVWPLWSPSLCPKGNDLMQATDMPTVSRQVSRFAFLDALRGMAAISIVGFHLYQYEPSPENSQWFMPFLIEQCLIWGWIGVQFLLVISGFVIAYSFRDGRVTSGSVANFLIRRVVRLSPPYLVTLLLILLLHGIAVSLGWFPSPLDEPPSWRRVASHLIYAQDLLGFSNLSAGLWTVCIEIQFYVLFGVGLLVAQRVWPVVTNGQAAASPRVLVSLFSPLAVMSLFVWCNQPALEHYVFYFFGLFFMGMVTWWVLDGRIPHGWYWATVGFFVARLLWQWKSEVMIGLIASLTIFSVGRSGHLHDWLNFRWLQYLGKISYSLYLIHYAVSHVVTQVGWALLNGSPSPPLAAACLAIAMASSIVAAHFLYVWVEAPSMRWAARLKPATSGFDARKEQAV